MQGREYDTFPPVHYAVFPLLQYPSISLQICVSILLHPIRIIRRILTNPEHIIAPAVSNHSKQFWGWENRVKYRINTSPKVPSFLPSFHSSVFVSLTFI